MRSCLGTLVCVVVAIFLTAPRSWAQLSGGALFEIGSATSTVGDDKGDPAPMYGMGIGAAYTFWSQRAIGLVVGADLLVRGFAINLPGRFESDAGVFDQSDMSLDQYIAAKFGKFTGGVYFEQRRINRGTALGKIGFPVTGIGLIVRAAIDKGGRAEVRFSYASFTAGELQLQGLDAKSPLGTGRSIRIAVHYRFATRWRVRAEYADTTVEFEPIEPTFAFLDHRMSLASVGLVLTF